MKLIRNAISAFVAILTFAAFAEEAYTPSSIAWLVQKDSESKGMNPKNLPGSGCWKVDGADAALDSAVTSSQDYGYSDSRYTGGDSYKLRIPESVETFEGKSLSVGDADNGGQVIFRTGDSGEVDELTIANYGLFLNNGSLHCNTAGSQILHGNVTVTAPESEPFSVYFIKDGSELKFTGAVAADAGKGLYVHSLPTARWPGDSSQRNFVCRFAEGSLSAFKGSLICGPVAWGDRTTKSNYFNTTDYRTPPYYATISSGTCEMPGTVTLYPGANLAAESSSTVFSVANLETVYDWGTNVLTVTMADDAKSCSLVKVTESLSLSTPLRIRLAGLENFSVDVATNAASKLAVFKAPASVTLDEEDFVLERKELAPHLPYLPDYRIEISNDEDGLPTVWIVARPVVWSLATDSGEWDSLFLESRKAYWSDGEAPSPEKDYLALHTIRTPKSSTAGHQYFGGNSLTMGKANAEFRHNGYDEVTVSNLNILADTGFVTIGPGISDPDKQLVDGSIATFVLNGRISADADIKFSAYQSKAWSVNSELSGRGVVTVTSAYQNYNNNLYSSWTGLFGMNTNYFGKFIVTHNNPAEKDRVTHLLFNDSRNFGAPLPEWTYDAIKLQRGSALMPISSIELNDQTRGIYVSATNTFVRVPENVVFTCKERITYNGILIKDGPGELALGGPAPYFNKDGGTGPTAGKNVLDLYEGVLRPISASALTGVNLTITNGATLVFNVPASNDDGDIGQYGILNKDVNTPMTLPESGITVEIEDPSGMLSSKARACVPICTVKASAKANLEGKLFAGNSSVPSFATKGEWKENEDGSWTFSALLSRGFTICIR